LTRAMACADVDHHSPRDRPLRVRSRGRLWLVVRARRAPARDRCRRH
jgi:hypothetical protein